MMFGMFIYFFVTLLRMHEFEIDSLSEFMGNENMQESNNYVRITIKQILTLETDSN